MISSIVARVPSKQEKQLPVVLDTRVVTGTGGGPDKTILNSPRYLLAAGYRNVCAYMHPPGDRGFEELRKKAELYQAPLLSVPDRGPWDITVVQQFLRICRREQVAIWHGHDYKSNALGILLRQFWPMQLVTTVHGWGVKGGRTPLYYRIDRLCLPRYDSVICVSEDLFREALACGVSRKRCELIENGVDTEEYARSQTIEDAKRKLGYPPERLLVGAVGRLSAEKGFDLLIRSVDELIRSGLDVGLWIIGEGDERARLERLIAELGRVDRIRLFGYRSDTIELYQALDVFALSSLREGLPNVLLEAMALEVPVVATRIAGIPRLIHPEENGLLIEPGEQYPLTEALRRLLREAELRVRLGRVGRQTIEKQYSFRVRMQRIQVLYDRLLGR